MTMPTPALRLRSAMVRLAVLLAALALLAAGCPAEESDEDEDVVESPEETPPAEPDPEPADEPADPDPAEQLTFAVTFEEGNLTPWTQNSGYPGYYMMTLVYDTLFWHNPELEPQGWLVEDWEVTDDGLTWTLDLREDVTFHDGEPLTAADVAFTVEYLTEHPRPRFAPTFEPIASVDTPDEHTVVFTLNEPRASFLLRPLADLPILPEHVWSQVEDPFEATEEPPIGSGPYRMVEFVPGELWRFEAYEDYFAGEPVVSEILMPYIAEPTTAFSAVRAGEADTVSAPLTPELATEFEALDDVALAETGGFRGWYLIMNAERAPFDDPEFRRALSLTVDIDEVVSTVMLGSATAGSPGFVHRDAPWANPDTADHTRDVEEANRLLDELGYEERDDDGIRQGPDGPLEFELLTRSDQTEAVRTAELISEWAEDAGIRLNVDAMEQATASDRMWPDQPRGEFEGDYFLGVHSWAGVIHFDPDFLTGLFHSDPGLGGLSRTGYANPEFDALTEEQEQTVDDEERFAIIHEMQELLAEEVPALALFYPAEIVPYRPEAFDAWTAYPEGILNKATFLPDHP